MDLHMTNASVTTMPTQRGQLSDSSVSCPLEPRIETQTVEATHNALKAEDLSVFLGSRCLLANTELTIAEQSHAVQICTAAAGSKTVQCGASYGLVGVNGCGKSTLLQIIADGGLPVPPKWDVFLVSQHLPTAKAETPVAEVMSADVRRTKLLSEQAALEAIPSDVDTTVLQEANQRLLQVHTELSKWDDAEKDVKEILISLGFRRSQATDGQSSEPTLETPINEMSGGWRMKAEIAKALWLQPKLLLLDEPTNHLDFQALQWLQERLEQYPYTTVVVSHDVRFLHGVCKQILWMKDLRLESMPRDMVSQDDLLRMQRRRSLNFRFVLPESGDAENHGLSLHGVEFSYQNGGSSRSDSCCLRVQRQVRFSGRCRSVLLGKNGSGKSTFLDLCAGRLQPTKGSIDRSADLKVGHYSQLTDDLDQNSTETAASYLARECPQELTAHTGSTRSSRLLGARPSAQQKRLTEIARGVLSHFGFEGDVAITAPVDRLSGGQKALLKLAVLSLRPVHLLILDEPTNHLDAEACEALAKALSEFQGGILAVTHDELLIHRLIHCNWTTSELLICRGGSVWREKVFGAQCLNALKSEVHRVEETSLKAMVPSGHHAVCDAKKNQKVVTTQELPPWLQRKSRVREKKEGLLAVNGHPVATKEVSEDSVKATPKTSSATIQKSLEPTHRRLSLPGHAWRGPIAGKHHDTAGVPPKLEIPPGDIIGDAPESWEDACESDATTEVPESEGVEEGAECDVAYVLNICKPDLHNTTSCQESERFVRKPMLNLADKEALKDSACKVGRHSRFRKDLVNLNKAVAKWLRQEETGEISHSQLIDRIQNSRVARQLRVLHGDAFEENQFVQDALKHAATQRCADGHM